jgi:cytidine deaminase
MLPLNAATKKKLLTAARHAQRRAYAPYSKFYVGAAVLTRDGQIFTGCNVENASYGLTICAERNAIFQAVSATEGRGKLAIAAVAVVNRAMSPCSPCGACRQVMAEFAKPDTLVLYQGEDGVTEMTMRELLPDCFGM